MIRRQKALKLLFLASLSVLFSVSAFSVAFADEIKYDSGARRDPFIPLVGPNGIITQRAASTDILIEGIIIDPDGGSVVLINGDLYRAGDRINDATIIQIFNDRILLSQEDEEKTIWLREEIAK